MLTRTHLERLAEVLIWGLKTARKGTGGEYKKRDIILIPYHQPALKLAEILFKKLLELGMNPIVRSMGTPALELALFEKGNNDQLSFLSPGIKELYESLNGEIKLVAPEFLTHLSHVDKDKVSVSAKAGKITYDIKFKREEEGNFGWTLTYLPTPAQAKQARLSFREYTNQFICACYLNIENPVAKWREIYETVKNIREWLDGLDIESIHIESAHIDLTVNIGDNRKWLGITGRNIPSFEIFLSPNWRKTSGIYLANLPSFRNGTYVEKAKFEFVDGRVVDATAETGEEYLKKIIATDEGAVQLGELSFTDKRISPITKFMANTLFDENYGGQYGNCHIALGSAYTRSYNGNPTELTKTTKDALGFNDSAIHWDLINTEEKRATAHLRSGKTVVIYENGMFKY